MRLPHFGGRLTLLTVGVFLIAVLGTAGLLVTESVLAIRVIFLVLMMIAAALTLTNRDRLLLALLVFYSTTVTLLSLFLTQAIPPTIVFIAVAFLSTILAAFVAPSLTPTYLLYAAGIGLFAVQLLWLVGPWPFDPKSKVAILTVFFYAAAGLERSLGASRRLGVAGIVWLFLILSVIVSVAEWQI